MPVRTDATFKEITCVLPRGEGAKLTQRLASEKDVTSTTVGSGRGHSNRSDVIHEVDMVTIIVDDHIADAVFAFIYHEFNFATQRGRIMFQASLHTASTSHLLPPTD